jgi:hypothetical protein
VNAQRLCATHSRGERDEQASARRSPFQPPVGSADCPMCFAESNDRHAGLRGTETVEVLVTADTPEGMSPRIAALWEAKQRERGVPSQREREDALHALDSIRPLEEDYDHAQSIRDRRAAGRRLSSALEGDDGSVRVCVRVPRGPVWIT